MSRKYSERVIPVQWEVGYELIQTAATQYAVYYMDSNYGSLLKIESNIERQQLQSEEHTIAHNQHYSLCTIFGLYIGTFSHF